MTVRRALGTLCAAVVLLGACSDEPDIESFCGAAERTIAAGPLFPDRTDGEPIAEPDALAALEDLAASSPDEISGDVEVLLAEARALVAEAEARDDASSSTSSTSTTPDGPPRPARAEVDAAQAAVVAYASQNCDLDLNA